MSVEEQVQAPPKEQFEEPEGLDQTVSVDLGEYPIDSLLIRHETRSVFEVLRRIRNGMYILDPDFQRDFVWEQLRQSRLIESALMRIPLPAVYFAEQPDGRIVVVDGLQRLTTFARYLNNDFALSGLTGAGHQLNKKYFKDLEPKLKNRLEDTQLILYLIDSKVPDQAKLDIFERVNSGVPLSRQQMRNCLYVGEATRWLKEQAKSEWFQRATGGSLNPNTMRDREVINRFCGFHLFGFKDYQGDMDGFLATTLKRMNTMEKQDLDNLAKTFEGSMQKNYTVFQQHTFRKHTPQSTSRSVINVALFDVLSTQMTKYSYEAVVAHTELLHNLFYQLMDNEEFKSAISISTNDRKRVRTRFQIINEVFSQELPAC